MPKAGGCVVTATVTASEVEAAPEVATMEVEDAAIGADADAVNVSVELTLPFAGGVTVCGLNEAVTPLGSPPNMSVTGELNPFWLDT